MASAPAPNLEFTGEQKQAFGGLAFSLRVLGGALLLFCVFRLVAGGWELARGSWLGLLTLAGAALAFVLGKILLTAADDAAFLVATRGHDRGHFLNTVTSVTMFLKALVGLAALVALEAILRASLT